MVQIYLRYFHYDFQRRRTVSPRSTFILHIFQRHHSIIHPIVAMLAASRISPFPVFQTLYICGMKFRCSPGVSPFVFPISLLLRSWCFEDSRVGAFVLIQAILLEISLYRTILSSMFCQSSRILAIHERRKRLEN